MKCEVCQRPATACCSGLDVPALYFCAVHAEDHKRICSDVRDGGARIVMIVKERRDG